MADETPDAEARMRAQQHLDALVAGRWATPFALLGIHPTATAAEPGRVVRAFLPWAEEVSVEPEDGSPTDMARIHPDGVWAAEFPSAERFFRYRLRARGARGAVTLDDPYRFPPTLTEDDLERLVLPDGRVHEVLGAHPMELEGVAGVRFAVWAPGAPAVSVVGDFNGWDERLHPMRPRGTSGVWELFLPGVEPGATYKFAIGTRRGRKVLKADPYARRGQLRPDTASIVTKPDAFRWTDADWLARRAERQAPDAPMSIYEVHAPSWKRHAGARPRAGEPGWLTYRELADTLLPHVRELGFTHVELMPVTEHPLDRSWGYQGTGYFAPSARQGGPEEFKAFVDRAHALGLGVILDWVPAHFASDAHGLALFTGAPLYEYPDPRRGVHPDWGSRIFDFGRPEVRAFLHSSALFWIEELHVDGLRIDAVASMLYLDYSRDEGAWIPNVYGGKEHLEAVAFLRELNALVHREHPGVVVIAEESTAWPGVTHPLSAGGLGFDWKWNMGWMHDTLEFFQADPLFRPGLYNRLTFSIMYAFSESFMLALSHDEVVHLKRSLLSKMPGPVEQQFANLRLLYGYLWTHPGKKLVFMGAELAEWREWDFEGQLDWALMEAPLHRGVRDWVAALNRMYADEPALHATDADRTGFEWIDCHDRDRTVLAWLRWAPEWEEALVVVANFAAVPWTGYRLAVPAAGRYAVVLDSDDAAFAGAGSRVPVELETTAGELHGREQWLELDLAPLTILVLKWVDEGD